VGAAVALFGGGVFGVVCAGGRCLDFVTSHQPYFVGRWLLAFSVRLGDWIWWFGCGGFWGGGGFLHRGFTLDGPCCAGIVVCFGSWLFYVRMGGFFWCRCACRCRLKFCGSVQFRNYITCACLGLCDGCSNAASGCVWSVCMLSSVRVGSGFVGWFFLSD